MRLPNRLRERRETVSRRGGSKLRIPLARNPFHGQLFSWTTLGIDPFVRAGLKLFREDLSVEATNAFGEDF